MVGAPGTVYQYYLAEAVRFSLGVLASSNPPQVTTTGTGKDCG